MSRVLGGIILSPTRELAMQTYAVVSELINGTNITHLLLTGGSNPAEDLERYNTGGCNIIIATPGHIVEDTSSAECRYIIVCNILTLYIDRPVGRHV